MSSYDVKHIKVRAIHDDVIVYNMDLGEQTTSSGIVIQSDDGKAHGVKPRWAQVYCVGPKQQDVKPGDWILIEHGRWTRKIKIDDGDGVKEIQKVETKSIMAISDEKPSGAYWGQEFSNGSSATFSPDMFM
jgi:co-chaperonin GroES (HSP10)